MICGNMLISLTPLRVGISHIVNFLKQFVIVIFCFSSLALNADDDTYLSNLTDYLENKIAEKRYRGITTLVAKEGNIVHFQGRGLRGSDDSIKTGDDTIYWIASMSKPVTGVALLMLMEEGKFNLNDPVSKYLPEFTNQQVYVSGEWPDSIKTRPVDREITIRDLMSFTSGLTYPWGDHPLIAAYQDVSGRFDKINLATLSQEIAKIPLIFNPGERFEYSISVDIQGRLIEVLSGMSFGEFLQKRLFNPLGMIDTGFWLPQDKLNRLATLYWLGEEGELIEIKHPIGLAFDTKPSFESGGHGLVSTVKDYWRFGQMLANGGSFNGQRFLQESTLDLMSTNYLPKDNPWQTEWSGPGTIGRGMGLNVGVVIDPSADDANVQIGEIGWNGGGSTVFWVDRINNIVAISMTNIMPFKEWELIEVMHDTIHGPKEK